VPIVSSLKVARPVPNFTILISDHQCKSSQVKFNKSNFIRIHYAILEWTLTLCMQICNAVLKLRDECDMGTFSL
jgi:hypothetical protein